MKALILKDFYVIGKQMKVFLLFILVMSAIPSSFNQVFAVMYAAILPYTAMAYDERSKWDQLSAMMPYSRREIVQSRYVFGWLCILAAAGLSALMQIVLRIFLRWETMSLTVWLVAICCAVIILAISLPMMFFFGVEKGRLAMFLIIFLICGSAGTISSVFGSTSLPRIASVPLLVLPAAACLLSLVSIPLSIRFYSRKNR